MAASKSGSTLLASASCTAGGTQTSSSLNLSAAYGALINASIANGSSAPTVACTATVYTSPDGSTWGFFESQTAGLTASTTYQFEFDVPYTALYCEVVFTGNTGQAVTVSATAQYVTGL